MVNHPITPQYAAWRAECCKADINLDSASHRRVQSCSPDDRIKRAKQRQYAATYRKNHHDQILQHNRDNRDAFNAWRRANRANKKAARLLEQSQAAQ